MNNNIWLTITEVAEAITQDYSVTDKEKIKAQYLLQVKQYPLYQEWFNRICAILDNMAPNLKVVEYGSGPGILAERLHKHKMVKDYTAIEPGETFREMTLDENPDAIVLNKTAETYIAQGLADVVVTTATYHHFHDKPKALRNIFTNLKKGGVLIIADVFLPNYEYDEGFNPTDKAKFVTSVMRYASAQIKAMPSPSMADIEDQIRTAFLDVLRIEELKVCLPIIQQQLEQVGFESINAELMNGNDGCFDWQTFGWYFITAKKPIVS